MVGSKYPDYPGILIYGKIKASPNFFTFILTKHTGHTISKGFTIIELLVIVAILSVLTSIVLANITNYVNKSKDDAIKESLNSIVINSSIYFESNGGYSSFCNDSATSDIFNSIKSLNKHCNQNSTKWAACARLNIPLDGSKAWCVDSVSSKKQINDSQCDNGMHACP